MEPLPELTKPDNEIVDLMVQRAIEVIQGLPVSTRDDLYLISVYVDLEEGSHIPEIRIGYNTDSQFKKCCPRQGDKPGPITASSAGEARWNYPFWIRDEVNIFGDFEDEDKDRALKERWMRSHQFWFTEDEFDEYDDECEKLDKLCGKRLWELATHCGLQLREAAVAQKLFDKDLPILVHECHLDGTEERFVRLANPDGQADDYLKGWIAIDPHTGKRTKG